MKIVAIEANIAAGKSTLLEPLAAALSDKTGAYWNVLKEPVDEDPVFLELLQVFVENPHDALYNRFPTAPVKQSPGRELRY